MFIGIIVVILLLLFIIFRLWNEFLIVFLPFALAVIITYLLNPVVCFLEHHSIPRYLGILLIYAFFFGFVIILSVYFVPLLLQDIKGLMDKIPEYSERFRIFIKGIHRNYERINLPESLQVVIDENIQEIQKKLILNLGKLSDLVIIAFGHMFSIILVPILTYYLLRDEELLKRRVNKIIPRAYRLRVIIMFSEIDKVLGAYLRGMLIISAAVGSMTYLGFLVFGVDFALILGIISGLTNFIPYFGPLIGAIPAVIIAFFSSPALVLRVIALIIIIQQIENQFIAPQILGRSLGFHPLSIIFLLLLGGRLMGLTGLIIIVPLVAIIRIIIQTLWPNIFNFES